MPNYDFKKDLPIARATEIEVAEILKKKSGIEILGFGNTNQYDILTKINGNIILFEVKEDFTCKKTGNVGVEFECRGKKSGIQTSKADYYIYKIHTAHYGIQFWALKTNILKKMIAEKKYFRIVNGGDEGSNSLNYLFKYNKFIENAKLLI